MRYLWADRYNRPLKDPLLDSYTLEDLLYEFYIKKEYKEAMENEAKEMDDKIQEEKTEETLKWAEEQERLEAELSAQEEAMGEKPIAPPEVDGFMGGDEDYGELPEDIVDTFG